MDRSEDISDSTVKNIGHSNYETALEEMREKEKELTKRTEMLENMMRSLSNTFTISSPSEAPAAASSSFNFSSPLVQAANLTNSFTPSTNYPKSYLRDALELVPKYDGHNLPVWQFARACKRAKEAVPSVDEALFVRMLRNKLSHHAYLAVEDENHLTVEKFLDSLKRIFGSGRSSNYYRGQLSMAYKKPNEHILDYIGRVKDLRTAIVEGDQTNLDRTLNETELATIESFALEALYEGLPREYRTELRAEGYSSFQDACSKILVINKRLEREEARNRNTRNFRDNSLPSNATRIPQRDPPNSSNGQSNHPDHGNQKICSYCKKFGHLVLECRKRQYDNNNSYRNFSNNNNNNQRYNNNNNYRNNDHNFRSNNNYRNNNNNYTNNNSGNHPPNQNSGNHNTVSVNGAPRGHSQAQPTNCMGGTPGPSTSSEETTEQYQLSSSNLHPSVDQ